MEEIHRIEHSKSPVNIVVNGALANLDISERKLTYDALLAYSPHRSSISLGLEEAPSSGKSNPQIHTLIPHYHPTSPQARLQRLLRPLFAIYAWCHGHISWQCKKSQDLRPCGQPVAAQVDEATPSETLPVDQNPSMLSYPSDT